MRWLVIVAALLLTGCTARWDDSANSGTNVGFEMRSPFDCNGAAKPLPVGGNAREAGGNNTTIGGGG